MKKVGIIYGSTTGTCDSIANTIAEKMGVEKSNVLDICNVDADKIAEYDVLLLGTSTWGDGELQDDWYDGLKTLTSVDLSNKTIAIFGCGDGESYCDTFCDGIGLIYQDIKDSGATIVGKVSTEGYNYSSSVAEVDGEFVGLPLDDVNEDDLTESRVENWVASIKEAI